MESWLQALEVIRKLRDVMPISRACMLLRIIFPVSIWNDMKIFLEEHAIVIVAESAVVEAEGGQDTDNEVEGNAEGHVKCSVLHKDDEGKKEKLMREKTMHLDIKADPELFRQVEEAVNTMAYGANNLMN